MEIYARIVYSYITFVPVLKIELCSAFDETLEVLKQKETQGKSGKFHAESWL